LWVPYGFIGFLCELAELLLCIHPVYLGASYAFLMKFSYLSKKKKLIKKKYIYIYKYFHSTVHFCMQEGGWVWGVYMCGCLCLYVYLFVHIKKMRKSSLT
jgi:hypothetical protein